MTALLDAIARTFVAPSGEARAQPVAAVAAASAAVCGPDADALGCALALLLRRRGPAVVCAWEQAMRRAALPATAGARRLAASMTARGLEAHPSGRLVLVVLDPTPSVAAAEAARVAAAAGEAPVVVALCGPRDGAFDQLLAVQDVAVVASGGDVPDEVVRLGVAALEATSRRAVAAPALSAIAAWAARAGLCASPAARRALAAATAVLR